MRLVLRISRMLKLQRMVEEVIEEQGQMTCWLAAQVSETNVMQMTKQTLKML